MHPLKEFQSLTSKCRRAAQVQSTAKGVVVEEKTVFSKRYVVFVEEILCECRKFSVLLM